MSPDMVQLLTMKKELHPKDYRLVVFMDEAAGFSFLTRSTAQTTETIKWEDGNEYPLVKVFISSKSHPFFTGEEKIIDTEGRVDRFAAKMKAAAEHKAKQAAKTVGKVGKDIEKAVEPTVEQISDVADETVKKATKTAKEAVKKVEDNIDPVAEKTSDAVDGATDAIVEAVEKIADAKDEVIEKAAKTAKDAVKKAEEALDK